MSMFTLIISCLTTSNLSWFMDLTFQVPMQCCSLQHRTFSITSHIHNWVLFLLWFSLFILLELFLHWAYWAPTNLQSSSFSILSFCLFILFMGFSKQEYWSGLPFPSSVDHIVSELSTVTHPSWVALNDMAHSFIELDKAVGRGCLLWPVCTLGKTIRLCPASFCTPRPNLPVTPGISWLPTFAF